MIFYKNYTKDRVVTSLFLLLNEEDLDTCTSILSIQNEPPISWMKKRMDMELKINYYMRYIVVLDSCQESLTGSSARSRGNKDQSGLSY